jgi:hypothetical protein
MDGRNPIKTAAGLLLRGGIAVLVTVHGAGAPTGRREFSIRQIQTIRDYTGTNASVQLAHVDAFRSDGARYASESFVVNGRSASVAALQLPNERKRIVMDLHTGLKSIYPASDRQVAGWRAAPPIDCSATAGATLAQTVRRTRMFGVEVQRFAIDGPTATIEHNLAPALGCFDLRMVARWKDSTGKYTSETSRETVELRLGSPDPALFVAPSGLKEAPPWAARNASHDYLHGPADRRKCQRTQ